MGQTIESTMNDQTVQTEEPEGLGHDEDSSLGEYPIDTLLIRNETRTVHDVLRRINEGRFVMDPDFQRDFIWDDEKQSKLIESVLMRIPLPVFYLAEDNLGRMVVVDGLQRLSTFKRYVEGGLKLKLRSQKELNKKSFRELSAKLQNRIEDCNLILYVIDSKVPERARLDIFERVNAGVPLTRQQMRNSLYQGEGTRLLKELANLDVFREATGYSLNIKTMRDREFVNRFCSFYLLGYSEYSGDMDDFLARGIVRMNGLDLYSIQDLHSSFKNSMEVNLALFGKQAFRKIHPAEGSRAVINASLWDVLSVLLARHKREYLDSVKDLLLDRFYELLKSGKFDEAITRGPSDKTKVYYRFTEMEKLLEVIGGAK